MLIVGAVIGAVISFFFIAGPMVVGFATALSVPPVLPLIGLVVALPFTIGLVGATIIYIICSLIAYLIAVVATTVPASGPAAVTPLESLARGVLLGMSTLVTLTLPLALPWLFQWWPPVAAVFMLASPLLTAAAIVLCIVNILPAFVPAIAANPVYAGVLGWGAWLMPGTWPATLLGLVFFVINAISALFGATVRWVPELWTGSLMTHGGILYPFWRTPVGFNLGNFYFLDPRFGVATPEHFPPPLGAAPLGSFLGQTAVGATLHETGHTLNTAAFGGWFNYIGWIHQNFVGATGSAAYAEMLAEAHMRNSTLPWFPFWAPPFVLTGTTSNAPPTYNITTVAGVPPTITVNTPAGSTLELIGTSTDADTYPAGTLIPGSPATGQRWVFAIQPAGVNAALANATAATTTAFIPRGGDYTLVFAATDGEEIAAGGVLSWPIKAVEAIIIGPAQAQVGDAIPLDGSTSTAGLDAPGLPTLLDFVWSVTPASATFDDPTSATPVLTVQEIADHVVTLTVTDPNIGGASHTVTHNIAVS